MAVFTVDPIICTWRPAALTQVHPGGTVKYSGSELGPWNENSNCPMMLHGNSKVSVVTVSHRQ